MGFFKNLFNRGNEAENNSGEIIVPESENNGLTGEMPIAQEQPMVKAIDGDGKEGFRGNKWGATKESVISTEKWKRIESDEADKLVFEGILFDCPCKITYYFFNNKLYESDYSFSITSKDNKGSFDKYYDQEWGSSRIEQVDFIRDFKFMKMYIVLREQLCRKYGNPTTGDEKTSLWQKMKRRGNPLKNLKECVKLVIDNSTFDLSTTWKYPATNNELEQFIYFSMFDYKLDYSEVEISISYTFTDVAFDAHDAEEYMAHCQEEARKRNEQQAATDNEIDKQLEDVGYIRDDVILLGFRDNKWGDSRDDVYDIESAEFEYDLGDSFSYKGNHFGLPCFIMFKFDDTGLYQGLYGFQIDGSLRQCIDEYKRIGGLLQKEYGEPTKGSITNAFWNEGNRKYFGKDEEDQFSNGEIWYHADWKCGNTGVFEALSLSEEGKPRLSIMYYDYYKSQMDALDELEGNRP